MMVDLDKMLGKSGGVSVTKSPKKRKKAIKVICEYDGDDTVGIHFDSVQYASKAAVLVLRGTDEVWIPFSQLKDFDAGAGALLCSKWIAEQKGLDPDW